MLRVEIIGGCGTVGVESLHVLAQHLRADSLAIPSRGDAGTLVSGLFPSFRGRPGRPFRIWA